MTTDRGLAGWLRLTLTPGIGPAAIRSLLREFGLPEAALQRGRRDLERHLSAEALAALQAEETERAVQRALEWLAAPGRALVTLADETYPRLLLEIGDPPPVLYAQGRLTLLQKPALAVVGSRNATPQGMQNAEAFSRALSDAGLTIVSGLALGIDAAAHRGGLAGAGSTIAILGTGMDVLYPARNAELAREIGQRGLLLSEFPLGMGALTHNFPRRNRLISGMALGCLVVEAAMASGSLITARAAADQGREVFAIPGSIHSPLSKGCHALLKSGAKLVESAEDVLSELSAAIGRDASRGASTPPRPGGGEEDPLLVAMGHDPADIDDLCARSGWTAERVAAQLLRLELDGQIAALPGGLYQRVRSPKTW